MSIRSLSSITSLMNEAIDLGLQGSQLGISPAISPNPKAEVDCRGGCHSSVAMACSGHRRFWEDFSSKLVFKKILATSISSCNLDPVCKLKSSMTRLTNRVQKVRDELEQLLDDDDDMADLYLSRKLAWASSPVSASVAPDWFLSSPTIGSKISRTSKTSAVTSHGENDVEEHEMLLERRKNSYSEAELAGTGWQLRESIDDTEDYINIQLDNHRNQLIQLELFLSSGTVGLSVYSLVAAIFGLNIPYTWKEGHAHVFKWGKQSISLEHWRQVLNLSSVVLLLKLSIKLVLRLIHTFITLKLLQRKWELDF